MADWTNLPNQAVGVGGLPSGATVTALRDNPVAIAEGAPGAPRIQRAAIQDGAVNASKLATGNSERNWVLGRTADASAGAVGTYVLARWGGTFSVSINSNVAGSILFPADASGGVTGTGSLSGTWKCMGRASDASNASRTTVWLRIS